VHTHTLRRMAAICLLSLSFTLTAPALADDWRSQWQELLPHDSVPETAIEAEDALWTHLTESAGGMLFCLQVTSHLKKTAHRLPELSTTDESRLVTGISAFAIQRVIDLCTETAAQYGKLIALNTVLLTRASRDLMAQIRKGNQGEPVSCSKKDAERIFARSTRRGMHVQRWADIQRIYGKE